MRFLRFVLVLALLTGILTACAPKQPAALEVPISYPPRVQLVLGGMRPGNVFCPGDTVQMEYHLSEVMYVRGYNVLPDGTAFQVWPPAGMNDLEGQQPGGVIFDPAMITPSAIQGREQMVLVAIPLSSPWDFGKARHSSGYCKVENFDSRMFPDTAFVARVSYTILSADDPACAGIDPSTWQPYQEAYDSVPLCGY